MLHRDVQDDYVDSTNDADVSNDSDNYDDDGDDDNNNTPLNSPYSTKVNQGKNNEWDALYDYILSGAFQDMGSGALVELVKGLRIWNIFVIFLILQLKSPRILFF